MKKNLLLYSIVWIVLLIGCGPELQTVVNRDAHNRVILEAEVKGEVDTLWSKVYTYHFAGDPALAINMDSTPEEETPEEETPEEQTPEENTPENEVVTEMTLPPSPTSKNNKENRKISLGQIDENQFIDLIEVDEDEEEVELEDGMIYNYMLFIFYLYFL